MNCIFLLLLLCCCGGCGNSCGNNMSSDCNCGCERNRWNDCGEGACGNNRERRAYAEAARRNNDCDCMMHNDDCMKHDDDCEAATMIPPSWQEYPGLSRDCDCK